MNNEKSNNLQPVLNSVYEIIKTITFVLLAAFIIRTFLIQPFVVEGQSMEPNFHNQEYLIVEKVLYRLNDPKRGDVIIFQAPSNPDFDYIKRIIALPGEKIKIVNNSVYVNNIKINESYLDKNELTLINQNENSILERVMGPNEYFVLGDNREHSSDSREFGALPKSKIIGHVWVTVYPWKNFGTVSAENYGL